MKVSEIKPSQKKIAISVRIIEKREEREVVLQENNSCHKVIEFLVGDKTACILLSVWDYRIERIEISKTYKLENAYTTMFKHSIRLNVGKFGTINESPEEIKTVNRKNNLSEKELTN